MEYTIQAWLSHMIKDIQLLEKVQQRATKCVYGLKNKTYQQRLKNEDIGYSFTGAATYKRRLNRDA